MMKRSSFVMPRARGDVVAIVAIGMLPDFILRKFAPARRFFYRLGTANQFGSSATRPCCNFIHLHLSISQRAATAPAHCLMQVEVKRCFLHRLLAHLWYIAFADLRRSSNAIRHPATCRVRQRRAYRQSYWGWSGRRLVHGGIHVGLRFGWDQR